MTQHTFVRFATVVIFILASAALTYAAPHRTFVSAHHGDDANTVNNCSVTLPCRNFNAAIGVVSAGGEVVALDSGGYGPTTISKAVTLSSPLGVYAAVTALVASTDAITVNAGSSDTVVLRGLTLTGLGGQYGIHVTSVGTLHVEGCVVSGFSIAGIFVALAADGSQIFIKDTITRNDGNNGGIFIATTTGQVRASIDNCRSEHNGFYGFWAANNSRVTINRSVASGNGSEGFFAYSNGVGVTTELSCEECVSSNNGTGFGVNTASGGVGVIRVARSTATNNTAYGFIQDGGVFKSLGNNLVDGNPGGNTSGTITTISLQ
jgi:hypothetical protein